MRETNQDGIVHLGLIAVVVLVIAIAVFAFWRIQTQEDVVETEATQPTTSEVDSTKPIQDAAELKAIEAELEATDIEAELDSTEFDEVLE